MPAFVVEIAIALLLGLLALTLAAGLRPGLARAAAVGLVLVLFLAAMIRCGLIAMGL